MCCLVGGGKEGEEEKKIQYTLEPGGGYRKGHTVEPQTSLSFNPEEKRGGGSGTHRVVRGDGLEIRPLLSERGSLSTFFCWSVTFLATY